MLNVLKQCERELDDWPNELRGELADAVARLERGHLLAMPLSRPMTSIGRGVHELRFRDSSGIYRVIYVLAGAGQIWLVHVFKKNTQQTPHQNIVVANDRIRRILR